MQADVCDHDIPHGHDPDLFWDNTFTALCAKCHNTVKKAIERKHQGQALLNEIKAIKSGKYIKRAATGVIESAGATLVWGPPCGGKSTWAKAEADRTGAVVYDLDDFAVSMGLPRYGRTAAQARRAMDHMRRRLGDHPADRRLILIATAPEPAKRQQWAKTLDSTNMQLVTVPQAECIARAKADPDRARHIAKQIEIIGDWFRRVS